MLRIVQRKFSSIFAKELTYEQRMAVISSFENPLPDYKINYVRASKEEYTDIKTNNGIQLILETPQIPSYVTISMFLKAGVGIESKSSSGYLNWLENSIISRLQAYPKILNNTKIDFDRDLFVVKSACMGYQTEEFVTILSSCFDNLALSNQVLQDLEYPADSNEDIEELLVQTAYSNTGYGKPIRGFKANFEDKIPFSIEAHSLHEKVIRPDNFFISVSGVYNVSEFVKIVESNFSYMKGKDQAPYPDIKSKSPYTGGMFEKPLRDKRKQILNTEMDMDANQFGVCYEVPGIANKIFYDLLVLESLIGEASYFASGGPGKGMYAHASQILRECYPSTSVKTFKELFSKSGLFGIVLKGVNNSFPLLYKHGMAEIADLKKQIDDAELDRAKNILKSKLLMNLERQYDRTEEIGRNYIHNNGNITVHSYIDKIDEVTVDSVHSAVMDMCNSKPTLVSVGASKM